MSKCPFAFALGVPGEGVHATRIFGFALVDILLTIAAAGLTAWTTRGCFWIHLAVWFVAGEVLHWLFGTPTEVLKRLGLVRDCA